MGISVEIKIFTVHIGEANMQRKYMNKTPKDSQKQQRSWSCSGSHATHTTSFPEVVAVDHESGDGG